MTKKLNIAAVQSELSGASAFFPSYTKPAPVRPPVEKTAEKPAKTLSSDKPGATPVRDVRPVLPVPPVRGQKRVMKSRHPFDIYEDQYVSLRDLAMQERMQGGAGSMSAMVREAIDAFIEKRRKR